MTLERMFAEAPVFGDSDLFALAVSERLNRGWSLRQLLIGGLGMLGGLIGGAQVLAGNLSLGQLMAFTFLSGGFMVTLQAMAREAMEWITMRPHLAALEAAFTAERRPCPSPPPECGPAAVTADGVWFRYQPDGPWVVRQVASWMPA